MLDTDFLKALLAAPGASSYESRPAAVWREKAESYGAGVHDDSYGNVFAVFGRGRRPRVMLTGHIDEIGLVVTWVDDDGFLYLRGIGGWDPQQLIGQRVRIVGSDGDVIGLIGKKPIHMLNANERGKAARLEDLWIDIGAKDREQALTHVRPGDFAVIEQPWVELLNGRVACKAIDNRIGAFVALEAARRAGGGAEVVAVATTQEEIGGVGAQVAAYGLEPDLALAIDVAHATDVPGIEKKQHGETKLGGGPELSVGSYVHRGVLAGLAATAERLGIATTIGTAPRYTATDADQIAPARAGVPTAVVSVPNRYMHSPNEMIDLADVERVIELLVGYLDGLDDLDGVRQPG